MASYLRDYRFGVGVAGGAEAIGHSLNKVVDDNKDVVGSSLLCVDFKNAFNMVDRNVMLAEVSLRCPSMLKWVEFLYEQPARLYLSQGYIWSSLGVQQGDPLGPLLFALALHPLILSIKRSCKLEVMAWYLDDGSLIGDTLEVSKALKIIQDEGPVKGFHLNSSKSELFWPVVDPRSLEAGYFLADIGRPALGVKLLGGQF